MQRGCYAQVAKEELKKINEIDLILGINEKNNIVNIVEEHIKNNQKEECVSDVMHQKEFLDFGCITAAKRNRIEVKIQDGCDRFCTYCIIPYARGRVRSRKKESIVEEVKELAKKQVKEVIITGIHIASYGKDFEEDDCLLSLLRELNKIDGIERIRLSSIEPTLMTMDFINGIKELTKVCHHFHLSLQSGCDETLKRMNRRYTTNDFREVVSNIRKAFDDSILTTDIIVRLPRRN